jgi:hypothetical protein
VTARDVERLFGMLSLILGAPILIFALFGVLILLFGTHGAGFWEVLLTVRYVPFVAWGIIFSGIGTILLMLSYRNE